MDHQWIKEVLHGQFEFPKNIFYTSINNILILHVLCFFLHIRNTHSEKWTRLSNNNVFKPNWKWLWQVPVINVNTWKWQLIFVIFWKIHIFKTIKHSIIVWINISIAKLNSRIHYVDIFSYFLFWIILKVNLFCFSYSQFGPFLIHDLTRPSNTTGATSGTGTLPEHRTSPRLFFVRFVFLNRLFSV